MIWGYFYPARDYKEWDMHGWRVGVSAISLPLAQLVERGDADPLPAALEGWASERRLDFLLLMTTHGQGEAFRRQLAVSAFGQQALNLLPSLVRGCPRLRVAAALSCARRPRRSGSRSSGCRHWTCRSQVGRYRARHTTSSI